MGQARNRKAEIDRLKALGSKKEQWKALRPLYIQTIKEDQEAYMNQLMACGSDIQAMEKVMKSGSNIRRATEIGLKFVELGVCDIAQIKDAAWEGFNGLLEACCVEMNIQHNLGLPVTQPNVDDFIITGPDSLNQAKVRGWV